MYADTAQRLKTNRPAMMFADNAGVNLLAIDPCPRASCAPKLVKPKPEPHSDADRPALKRVKLENKLHAAPSVAASSACSRDIELCDEDEDDIKSFCVGCDIPLSDQASYPKPKTGREWSTKHVEHRCKACWMAYKEKLMLGLKTKEYVKKPKSVVTCDRCGSTGHGKKDCYLKKHALVSVLYEGKWWPAQILLVHRGANKGYKVKYFDEQGCTQSYVSAVNIRPRSEDDSESKNSSK